tara:strand:- start:78 stop:539 length:462 start_codon:yes stop_codon:yes gene_type:complete
MPIISKEDFKIKRELNRPILSLDYGEKRIGIAISDSNCTMALPSEVLIREKNKKDFLYIKEFIKNSDIQALVIGMPYNVDGSDNEKCKTIKKYSQNLLKFININIIFWDENFSTAIQEEILIKKNLSRKKRKKIIDKLAASYFLQNFLDFLAK